MGDGNRIPGYPFDSGNHYGLRFIAAIRSRIQPRSGGNGIAGYRQMAIRPPEGQFRKHLDDKRAHARLARVWQRCKPIGRYHQLCVPESSGYPGIR